LVNANVPLIFYSNVKILKRGIQKAFEFHLSFSKPAREPLPTFEKYIDMLSKLFKSQ